MTTLVPALNLETQVPRSPLEKMNGMVWIPRLLDKARAARANRLGEYRYPCPMDEIVLDFLGMAGDAFADMAMHQTDDAVHSWLKDKLQTTTPDERHAVNQAILEKRPDSKEKRDKFKRIRDEINPSRSDIQTWAALIDLEEGRS